MNTPNKLTVLRLIMVPFYVFFILVPVPHHYLIAAAIFGAAAYTDHLDGKLARKHNMITDFGKFADPLADKIMILAALACFIQVGITNAVILIIIVAREFMVTSIRLVAEVFSFWFGVSADVLLGITAALTVISGVIYIVQNFEFIKNAK